MDDKFERYWQMGAEPAGPFLGVLPVAARAESNGAVVLMHALTRFEGLSKLSWSILTERPQQMTPGAIPSIPSIDVHLTDDLGTEYVAFPGGGGGGPNEQHYTMSFRPGIPDSATRLTIHLSDVTWREGHHHPFGFECTPQTYPWSIDIPVGNQIDTYGETQPSSEQPARPPLPDHPSLIEQSAQGAIGIVPLSTNVRLEHETLALDYAVLLTHAVRLTGRLMLDDDHPELEWRRKGRGGEPAVNIRFVDEAGNAIDTFANTQFDDRLHSDVEFTSWGGPEPSFSSLDVHVSAVEWFSSGAWNQDAPRFEPMFVAKLQISRDQIIPWRAMQCDAATPEVSSRSLDPSVLHQSQVVKLIETRGSFVGTLPLAGVIATESASISVPSIDVFENELRTRVMITLARDGYSPYPPLMPDISIRLTDDTDQQYTATPQGGSGDHGSFEWSFAFRPGLSAEARVLTMDVSDIAWTDGQGVMPGSGFGSVEPKWRWNVDIDLSSLILARNFTQPDTLGDAQ